MKKIILLSGFISITLLVAAQTKSATSKNPPAKTTTTAPKTTAAATTTQHTSTATKTVQPAAPQPPAPAKKVAKESFHIELGPNFAHPIRYLNMFGGIGLGLDGAVTRKIWQDLSVGIRVNYTNFFGRAADPLFTGGGDHFKHINLYNASAEANYKLPYNIVAGLELGVSLLRFNGESDFAFAKKIYAGYQWDHGDHPIIFAVFFEQTTYHKNAGLRATYRF